MLNEGYQIRSLAERELLFELIFCGEKEIIFNYMYYIHLEKKLSTDDERFISVAPPRMKLVNSVWYRHEQ